MNTPRYIFGLFLLALGVAAFVGMNVFKLLLALVLIFFGLRILVGWPPYPKAGSKSETKSEGLNEVVILGNFNRAYTSENFTGGKLVLVFAGGELDLSQAGMLTDEVELEVVAIFSGLKITVPDHWRVRTRGTAIVGGYDNKAKETTPRHTLVLTGAVIFGGVEVV